MAATLGALHRVDPAAVGLSRFGRPDEYSRRQLERWARQYRDCVSVPEPPVVALIDWLRANVPPSEPSGALVHGDFRLDNLVFGSPLGPRGAPDDSGGVVAVLDWELSTLGAPYSDVAYNCMPYHLPPLDPDGPAGGRAAAYPAFPAGGIPEGVPSEREYVRAWSASSGLPDPTTPGPDGIVRWPFYVALSLFRGAAILAGVRARARGGERVRARRGGGGNTGGDVGESSAPRRGDCARGRAPGDRVGGDGAENAAPRDDARGRVRTESAGGGASGHAASVHVRARLPRRGGARGARGVAGSLVCVRGG